MADDNEFYVVVLWTTDEVEGFKQYEKASINDLTPIPDEVEKYR
jgi:hypothetical protein